MSDAPDTPTPEPTVPDTPAEPAAAPDDVFENVPDDQAVFDRGWVDKLRNEGRRYREEARTKSEALSQYEDTFGQYEPGDRDVWFELARTWAHNPQQSAAMMREIANNVLGEIQAEQAASVASDEPDDGDDSDSELAGMDREQIEELIAERLGAYDEEMVMQNEVAAIFGELEDAGFDPESRQGLYILRIAQDETQGDIAKAVDVYKKEQQGVVDKYVAERSASGRSPLTPRQGVVATSEQPIKNLEDARKATEAFLKNQQRNAG